MCAPCVVVVPWASGRADRDYTAIQTAVHTTTRFCCNRLPSPCFSQLRSSAYYYTGVPSGVPVDDTTQVSQARIQTTRYTTKSVSGRPSCREHPAPGFVFWRPRGSHYDTSIDQPTAVEADAARGLGTGYWIVDRYVLLPYGSRKRGKSKLVFVP